MPVRCHEHERRQGSAPKCRQSPGRQRNAQTCSFLSPPHVWRNSKLEVRSSKIEIRNMPQVSILNVISGCQKPPKHVILSAAKNLSLVSRFGSMEERFFAALRMTCGPTSDAAYRVSSFEFPVSNSRRARGRSGRRLDRAPYFVFRREPDPVLHDDVPPVDQKQSREDGDVPESGVALLGPVGQRKVDLLFLSVTMTDRIVVVEPENAVGIGAHHRKLAPRQFLLQSDQGGRLLHAGGTTGEPDVEQNHFATERRRVHIRPLEARQLEPRARLAFPAAQLPRDGLSETRIAADHGYVDTGDLAALWIAGEEARHPRVRLHHPQQHVGGAGLFEVELLVDGLQARRLAELLLVLDQEKRNAKERVVELIESLALVRLGEGLGVELAHHQGLAGLYVIPYIA